METKCILIKSNGAYPTLQFIIMNNSEYIQSMENVRFSLSPLDFKMLKNDILIAFKLPKTFQMPFATVTVLKNLKKKHMTFIAIL